MIKHLALKNFRSILESDLSFSTSGVSVVVGANGSGKSNLIKAIQFLAHIAREDLDDAVYAQRGVDAMLPKAYAVPTLRAATCTIASEHSLFRPAWYPREAPSLEIAHSLSIGRGRAHSASVRHELLQFTEPLAVQYYEGLAKVATQSAHEAKPLPSSLFGSVFAIERFAEGGLTIRTTPDFQEQRQGFLDWLGLGFFGSDIEMTLPMLIQVLQSLNQGSVRSTNPDPRHGSWLSQKGNQPLSFCTEANTFRGLLADVRHYDFQLARLRQEQEATATDSMAVDGAGFPAVIRRLKEAGPRAERWQRIATTMQAIAPHVLDATVSRLTTGKEFVKFVETRTGRSVESWESSDGTLRALAILVAVESHDPYGTILIEEPEHGLHPWAVRVLMDHVRQTVAERHIQVIATTHSEHVLDAVHPSEVVVASRTVEEGTIFRRIVDVIPESRLLHGGMGRLWVEGLLGGVPHYE